MPGTLTIRPLQANLKHNKDFLLNRSDPYCEFLLGGQRARSSVCHEGGKHPHWGDTITLHSNNEPVLYVKLKDKDTFSHDDDIGMCEINLSTISSYTKGPQWYPVFHGQSSEGEVLLDINYNPGMQPGYGQPAPMYGGMPTQMPTAYPMSQPTTVYNQPTYPVSQPMTQPGYPMTQGPVGYPGGQVYQQPMMTGVVIPGAQPQVYPTQGYPTQGYPAPNMGMYGGYH